jgi:hypothetical protein
LGRATSVGRVKDGAEAILNVIAATVILTCTVKKK